MLKMQADKKVVDEYVKLAKEAVEEFIKNKKVISVPKDLPLELYSKQAGVFVTIYGMKESGGLPRSHAKRVLRGCIGTILPTKKNLAEEIVSNAIAACSRDNRFAPITEEEFAKLSFEVSILNEPTILKNLKNHDPQKHGLIVKCADGRCGLLLPDIDGIDAFEQQINIACQKGGIDSGTDDISLFQFTVEKHK